MAAPRLPRDSSASRSADAASGPPAKAANPSAAYQLAVQYLGGHLVIPDQACVDLQDLDAATEAQAWGQTSWRAFRALHAYARDLADPSTADFWTWCSMSGNPHVWTATDKKLAMRESQTVMRNRKLQGKRMLPVGRSVHPTGRIEMQAHMKIAEGGSDLAPRIYFHVDRASLRVHVGYFGPHRHMPNSKT